MNKWRKQLGEMEKHSWNWYESYLEAAKQRDAAREREAAALHENDRGYTIDNVVACCGSCNMAKNTMSMEQFRTWVYAVYQRFALSEKYRQREQETTLSKIEELRRDNVRLATELARVQGVCDANEAQRRNLLALQRGVTATSDCQFGKVEEFDE